MTTQKVRPDKDFMDRQDSRQRRRMRNRKVGAFAMVAAIAAIAVVAVAEVRNGQGDPPIPASPASPSGVPSVVTNWYFDIATGERSQVAATLSEAKLLQVSPDYQNIVYGTCCGRDALTVAALDGSESKTITPDTLDAYAATWVDTETILFQGRPAGTTSIGDLYVANVSTGELTMVVDLPDMKHGAWIIRSDLSPDGRTVLFHLPRGRWNSTEYDLWTAPLAGGEPTRLRTNAGFGAYASDGRIVLLEHPVPFEGDAIWIMEGDGSGARPIVENRGDVFTWPQFSPDGTMIAYGHDGEAEIIAVDGCCETGGAGQATGEFSEELAWFGNDTLIVE